MAYINNYLLQRTAEIQAFAREHYEPGRHDRSWRWVWEYRVYPKYHISYRTFKRYMSIDVEAERAKLAEKRRLRQLVRISKRNEQRTAVGSGISRHEI